MLTGTQKIVIAALGGALGAYVGRKYTWKYSAPIIEKVLPSHGKWMKECPMHEAILLGVVLNAGYAAVMNAMEEDLKK